MINPLLLEFPDSFETERLIIRAPRPKDAELSYAAVRESAEDLRPWMPWATSLPSLEETRMMYRRAAAGWIAREQFALVLIRRSDGLFVGRSGLERVDWSVPCMEIGYWCRTSLVGQGYITEAVRGITAFAFEHLQAERLEIRCDVRNTRSAAVAERAGYVLEARLHHQMRDPQDQLRDTLVFVKFRED